jgi:tRNA (cytidine/uridine-2'-O-)-methyltransferase
VFGCETKGLPDAIREQHRGREFHLPMRSEHIRSLNLANTVTAVVYQALRGRL